MASHQEPQLLRPWLGWFVLIVASYAAVVVVSVLYGIPTRLPGVTLGFPLLLHLERAGAVLAVVGAVLVVARLTWLGYLPNQFGNIGYTALARRHEFEQSVAELRQRVEERLDPLEIERDADGRALALVRQEIDEILSRLNALEARQAE